MNFVGYFCLLNNIPYKLEVVKELQELPYKPNDKNNKCSCCEAYHSCSIFKFSFCCDLEIINKEDDSELKSNITKLNDNVDEIVKFIS